MYHTHELAREPRVLEIAGRKRSAMRADVADGKFPPPVKIGRNSVWPLDEVRALNAARIAGATDDELRELVGRMVAARRAQMPQAA